MVKNTKSKSSKSTKKDVSISNVNISKHILVPKHRILSEKESKILLEKYNISIHQLPLLRTKDPMAIAINAKIGDIVEITRDGPTRLHPFFRRVI